MPVLSSCSLMRSGGKGPNQTESKVHHTDWTGALSWSFFHAVLWWTKKTTGKWILKKGENNGSNVSSKGHDVLNFWPPVWVKVWQHFQHFRHFLSWCVSSDPHYQVKTSFFHTLFEMKTSCHKRVVSLHVSLQVRPPRRTPVASVGIHKPKWFLDNQERHRLMCSNTVCIACHC